MVGVRQTLASSLCLPELLTEAPYRRPQHVSGCSTHWRRSCGHRDSPGRRGVRTSVEVSSAGHNANATGASASTDPGFNPEPGGERDDYSDDTSYSSHYSKFEDSSLSRAVIVFDQAVHRVEAKFGRSEMVFPKDIMWLAGAPGAGKGTLTDAIMELRHVTMKPIEISALLDDTPRFREQKARGELIGDEEVLVLLLEALVERTQADPFGAIVDGFPRTKIQAHCISLLFDYIRALRREFYDAGGDPRFRRPIFHITVLHVGEATSVERQLLRGRLTQEHNAKVRQTGVGQLRELRPTDLDDEKARQRYHNFESQLIESLNVVKHRFHFHFIDAEASIDKVRARVRRELEYQSSLELAEETFEAVRRFPLASELTAHARQELVRRLDFSYETQRETFHKVLSVLEREFQHLMKRQALTGRAIIRTTNPLFLKAPEAIGIALDVLSERGFNATVDVKRETSAAFVDTNEPSIYLQNGISGERMGGGRTGYWPIQNLHSKILVFDIQWEPPRIRRGTSSL